MSKSDKRILREASERGRFIYALEDQCFYPLDDKMALGGRIRTATLNLQDVIDAYDASRK